MLPYHGTSSPCRAGAFCIAKRHRAHRLYLFRAVERLMLAGRKSDIVSIGIW
jgi:hypothetical protein